MIANYHTHTWRCRHADGTEREYVERAIEAVLKFSVFPTIRLIRSRTATIPACGCGSIRWKAM